MPQYISPHSTASPTHSYRPRPILHHTPRTAPPPRHPLTLAYGPGYGRQSPPSPQQRRLHHRAYPSQTHSGDSFWRRGPPTSTSTPTNRFGEHSRHIRSPNTPTNRPHRFDNILANSVTSSLRRLRHAARQHRNSVPTRPVDRQTGFDTIFATTLAIPVRHLGTFRSSIPAAIPDPLAKPVRQYPRHISSQTL